MCFSSKSYLTLQTNKQRGMGTNRFSPKPDNSDSLINNFCTLKHFQYQLIIQSLQPCLLLNVYFLQPSHGPDFSILIRHPFEIASIAWTTVILCSLIETINEYAGSCCAVLILSKIDLYTYLLDQQCSLLLEEECIVS
jgi:hypothetical protein